MLKPKEQRRETNKEFLSKHTCAISMHAQMHSLKVSKSCNSAVIYTKAVLEINTIFTNPKRQIGMRPLTVTTFLRGQATPQAPYARYINSNTSSTSTGSQ